jgi:hypothetical protein
MLRTRALRERETLDEGDILEITGLPPAPLLENRKVPDEGPSARSGRE